MKQLFGWSVALLEAFFKWAFNLPGWVYVILFIFVVVCLLERTLNYRFDRLERLIRHDDKE